MSGAALGVAAIGAIGAGVSAYAQSSAANSAANARVPSQSLIKAAAGTNPKPALYKPVDFSQSQLETIWNNGKALPYAQFLASATDKDITKNALQRINSLVPGYSSAIGQMGANANSLLKGQLPFDDVQSIMGNASAQQAGIGIPGAAGPVTLKDLGLSQLGAQQSGASMLQSMIGMADQVSPTAGYLTPQSQFLSPADQIQNEMSQNQIIQQSEQNANNLNALGDPAARLQLGLQVGGALTGGTQSPGASALGAGLSGLGSVLGSLGRGSSGGFGGTAGSAASGGLLSSLFSGSSSSSSPNSAGFYPSQSAAINAYGGGNGYIPNVSYYGGGGQPGASTGWYLQNYTGA